MRLRLFMVFTLLLQLVCIPGISAEEGLDLDGMVKILKAAQKLHGKPTPKALTKKGGALDKGGYDPNEFLALFPRLGIASGQVLDFVYDYQELGGHPVLYARPSDQAAFPSFAEFKKIYPKRYFIGDASRYDPVYLGSIVADGTPDGFLQLAIIVLIGEQFYIHWHAVYYMFLPILDQRTFDGVLGAYKKEEAEKGRTIDFRPRVTLEGDRARVEYHVFNEWTGIKRIVWTVNRAFPHRLVSVEEKVLLPYKSPIQF
ncbi:MAG TPA: hypothetical protein PLY73_11935 [Candidatus Ozemobacteraceae bacterium]|nr:hypothetical protein [Candidatus Ozemobacteraceae bacterium]